MECAVWYWRYHHIRFETFNNEKEAMRFIYYCLDENGDGVAEGVQFPDGRFIFIGDWPEFEQFSKEVEQQQRERWEQQKSVPPPPKKEIYPPFHINKDSTPIPVDLDTPDWVGLPKPLVPPTISKLFLAGKTLNIKADGNVIKKDKDA